MIFSLKYLRKNAQYIHKYSVNYNSCDAPRKTYIQFENYGLKTWKHEEEITFQIHTLPPYMWVSY